MKAFSDAKRDMRGSSQCATYCKLLHQRITRMRLAEPHVFKLHVLVCVSYLLVRLIGHQWKYLRRSLLSANHTGQFHTRRVARAWRLANEGTMLTARRVGVRRSVRPTLCNRQSGVL